jgi:phage gp16-like protein
VGALMNRRGLLATVHIAKKELALDESTYRAVLERVTGGRADSAADLTDDELGQVVDHFKAHGWTNKKKRFSGQPHVRKVWALWGEMHRAGIVKGAMRPALRAFVKRMTGVTDPEWLDPSQARTVIESLKQWRARAEAGHVDGQ